MLGFLSSFIVASLYKVSDQNYLNIYVDISCFSLCADTHDWDVNPLPSTTETSALALYTSLSTSPSISSSSPGISNTAFPVNLSLCKNAHGAPVMAGEYGASPPCMVATPSSCNSSESEVVFFQEENNRDDLWNGTLRKCMSESFANPSEELKADFMYSAPRPTAKVIQKKIHVPVKENKKYVSGTWHGVRDQRQPSSGVKSNMSAATKGHKRSQSDMGIGATRTHDISLGQDSTSQFCADEATPATVKSPASDLNGKTVQRSQRGKCLYLKKKLNCCAWFLYYGGITKFWGEGWVYTGITMPVCLVLSRRYFLNHSAFCNQTWYVGASSWDIGVLCS